MSDIVERLRHWSHGLTYDPAAGLMHEAAAEIDRLRLRHGWIPVSERLPEGGQNVIACFTPRQEVGEATFNELHGWFCNEHGAWGASHWMPLPEPPEST